MVEVVRPMFEADAPPIDMFHGILDYRDQQFDRTASFDFATDRAIAERLIAAFPRTTTYNEIYAIQLGIAAHMRAGGTLDTAPETLTNPEQLRPAQLRNGRDMLTKVDAYLDGSKYRKGTALEDGAGIGLNIDGFAEAFDHVFVVDISLVNLVLAKRLVEERALTNVTLVCANVERLPFADSTFDFIHSNNVVEHVTDQAALFREAERTLKQGGLLFVKSPNRFSLYTEPHFRLPAFGFIPKPISRRIIRARQNRGIDHVKSLSLRQLRGMLGTAFHRKVRVSFLPRRVNGTTLGGKLRSSVAGALNAPVIGTVADAIFNKVLLPIAPYHVAVCFKGAASSHER